MSNDDNKHFNILLEQIKAQNQVTLEAVTDMRAELKQVPKREEFDELKQDIKVIRAAVTQMLAKTFAITNSVSLALR